MWFMLGFVVSWAIATIMKGGLIRRARKMNSDFQEYTKLYYELRENYVQLKKKTDELLKVELKSMEEKKR